MFPWPTRFQKSPTWLWTPRDDPARGYFPIWYFLDCGPECEYFPPWQPCSTIDIIIIVMKLVKRPLPWWNYWGSVHFSSLHNLSGGSRIWHAMRSPNINITYWCSFITYIVRILNIHCSACVSSLWRPHTSGCCRPYCSDAEFLPSSALVNQPFLKTHLILMSQHENIPTNTGLRKELCCKIQRDSENWFYSEFNSDEFWHMRSQCWPIASCLSGADLSKDGETERKAIFNNANLLIVQFCLQCSNCVSSIQIELLKKLIVHCHCMLSGFS